MSLLRLMTHNQWKNDHNRPDWEKQGKDCSASCRMRGFVRVYRETLPDVIGCQEVSAVMADKLIRYAAEEGLVYALLWGRDTPILYRQDKLELVDSVFGLYPDAVPGYEGVFNNEKTKSYNIAVMRVKESGRLFLFASTHLWWKSGDPRSSYYQPHSDEARAYQMSLLIERIEQLRQKYGCPAIIVGDLNTGYRTPTIEAAFANGYLHAHDIATDFSDEEVGYHACFAWGYHDYYDQRPFETAIDHILLRDMPLGAVKRFARFSPDYYLPLSDHSPAYIDVEI